jgi:LPXTG-motif cell wall-anchored protein
LTIDARRDLAHNGAAKSAQVWIPSAGHRYDLGDSMKWTARPILRTATTATLSALAAGALMGVSPAHAAQQDTGLLLSSNRNVVVDQTYNDTTHLSVFHVPDKAAIQISFDLAKLDKAVVHLRPALPAFCRAPKADTVVCDYTMQWYVPNGPFMHLKMPFQLERTAGGEGAGGTITAALHTEAVPVDEDQGSVTLTVEVPGKDKVPTNGVDLALATHDVYQIGEHGYTDQPVAPGGVSAVVARFANFGDKAAKGVKVSVTLPEHVAFNQDTPGCTTATDKRTLTCAYNDLILDPISTDPDPLDDGTDGKLSTAAATYPVRVAADAPGPVVLSGGAFTATPLGAVEPAASLTRHKPVLPNGLKPAAKKEFADADPTDNTAEFAVHIGPRTGGTGGGAGAPAGGAGDGGTLPITGSQAGVLGGVGGGAVILGIGLYLLARRRRVVAVTPTDEA